MTFRLKSWNDPTFEARVLRGSSEVVLDLWGTGRLRIGAVTLPAPARLEKDDRREKLLGAVLVFDWVSSKDAVSASGCDMRSDMFEGVAGNCRRLDDSSAR